MAGAEARNALRRREVDGLFDDLDLSLALTIVGLQRIAVDARRAVDLQPVACADFPRAVAIWRDVHRLEALPCSPARKLFKIELLHNPGWKETQLHRSVLHS